MGQAAPTLPGDESTLVFNPGQQLPRLNYDDEFRPLVVLQGAERDVQCPGHYIVTDHCLRVEFVEEYTIRYDVDDVGYVAHRTIESSLVLLPSIQCHISESSFGTVLRVAGSWPVFGMSFVFKAAKEAEDVKRRLVASAHNMVLAAHFYEPDGAPPLTLTPLHTRPGPSEEKKGRFIVGGYVLATDIPDRDNAIIDAALTTIPSPPKYRMYWTELCGPDKTGYIKMYFYNTHERDCIFLGLHVWPKPGEEEVIQNAFVIRIADEFEGWPDPQCLPTQAFLSFRSEQMAEMWRDLALQTYETGTVPADPERERAVNDGVHELMQNARHLGFLRPL